MRFRFCIGCRFLAVACTLLLPLGCTTPTTNRAPTAPTATPPARPVAVTSGVEARNLEVPWVRAEGRVMRWMLLAPIKITKSNLEGGPAVEQGPASGKGHMPFRPPSYWYTRRQHLRELRLRRDCVGGPVPLRETRRLLEPANYVKRRQRSKGRARDEKRVTPPVKPTKDHREGRVCGGPCPCGMCVRSRYGNLLRKRAGYAKYFDTNLREINASLKRVQIKRMIQTGVQVAVQGDDDRGTSGYILPEPRLTRGAVSDIKRALVGVERQEKKILQKYVARCTARAGRRQRRFATRLETWEAKQKRREKNERDREAREALQARERLFNELGPAAFERLLRSEEAARRRRRPDARPFYFDENGRRIRIGTRRSVVG